MCGLREDTAAEDGPLVGAGARREDKEEQVAIFVANVREHEAEKIEEVDVLLNLTVKWLRDAFCLIESALDILMKPIQIMNIMQK